MQEAFCDLGTDCSDCGSWTHLMPAAAEVATPVADLAKSGIRVFTKWTRTLPSFLMAFTDPEQDVDVSGQMHVNGNIELGLTQVRTSEHAFCNQRMHHWPCSRMHCHRDMPHYHALISQTHLSVDLQIESLSLAASKSLPPIPVYQYSFCTSVLQVWYTLLSQQCKVSVPAPFQPGVPEKGVQQARPATAHRGLVVDVGANFGYYSLYAAAHGCRYLVHM